MNFMPRDAIIAKNRFIQIVVFFSLVFFGFVWVTGLLLYVEKIGFTPASVKAYYLGSEEEFRNPISYLGLLEITHFHFFAYGLSLLLLNHLMLFLPLSGGLKLFVVVVSFFSGLVNISAGWFIRYVSPQFVYLKIGSFILFYLSFLALLLLSFFAMARFRRGSAENQGEKEEIESVSR